MEYATKTLINFPISGVTASGNEAGSPPSNVVDNDLSTKWSNPGIGSWIRADLGSIKNICSVDIAWWKGDERQYNFVIATSTDGTTFTNKLTSKSSGTELNSEKYTIDPTNARYVKITVNGNTATDTAHITELDIFGKSSPTSRCTNEWKIEDIPFPNTLTLYAVNPSIVVDSDGVPHISYTQTVAPFGSNKLIHARIPGIWQKEEVLTFGLTAQSSIAIDKLNEPHFIYTVRSSCDRLGCTPSNPGDPGGLAYTQTHAFFGGAQNWIGLENTSGAPVKYPNMAVDSIGNAHISYDFKDATIKYAAVQCISC